MTFLVVMQLWLMIGNNELFNIFSLLILFPPHSYLSYLSSSTMVQKKLEEHGSKITEVWPKIIK
jgi:hypothetical protein